MTLKYAPVVVCDGCKATYTGFASKKPEGQATILAADMSGWYTRSRGCYGKMQDYCPKCAETTAPPKLEQPSG